MEFEQQLVAFREHLKERNLSERTVETYGFNVRKFLCFLKDHYSRIDGLEKVTREIVQDYQRYMATGKSRSGRPVSNSTQILKLIAVRSFFSFLIILAMPSTSLSLERGL